MSAQPVTEEPGLSAGGPRLALVKAPTAAVSALGFALILAVVIALGLAGVMVVSTSVGQQSRDLSVMRRQATELGYTAASLESQVQTISSANALALRATELGMVPNPYPAFINLADGSVTGVPQAVKGDELPALNGVRPEPELSKGPVDPTRPAADAAAAPSDLSADAPVQEQP